MYLGAFLFTRALPGLIPLFVLGAILMILAGCTSTTETGAIACRGTAFDLNAGAAAPLSSSGASR